MNGEKLGKRDTTFPFSYFSLLILFPSLSLLVSIHASVEMGRMKKKLRAVFLSASFPLQPRLNSINPEIPAVRVI